jgi:uracil-DNA glycosylase family 4
VRAKPNSCAGCAIVSHGTDFSRIEGTGANGVMLVGEASGENEARECLPFRPYANAGSILQRTLREMGLDRAQFSITNAVRCRPRRDWLEKSPWEYSAINHCRPNLVAAIAEHKPRVIVALGGTALRTLTGMAGEALGITHLAGYVLPCTIGDSNVQVDDGVLLAAGDDSQQPGDLLHPKTHATPVIGEFHPSYIRRGKASHRGIFARILKRALNIAAGRDTNYLWNINPEEPHASLTYQTHPSLDEARGFLQRVRDSSGAVVSYDIETAESASLDEDAREGFSNTDIRLVQFSIAPGEGIAFPWDGGYREIARDILHTPNVKCGHNVWLFDNKVLRAAGEREGLDLRPRGTVHDTLAMFHHWQPDLPAHLQFAAQFVQFPFPWKHLAATNIEFYSTCDVDATLRVYKMLERTLTRDEIMGDDTCGYLGQVAAVRPILAAMEDRGLPIDNDARLALDVEFGIAQDALGKELAERAPASCSRVQPKEGYKGEPPEVKLVLKACMERQDDWLQTILAKRFQESGDGGERYACQRREFSVAAVDAASGEPVSVPTTRWCRVYDFNPNSNPQIKAYMVAKGHPIPKSREEDDEGNRKDTTNKKELQRLSRKTGDTFYLKVIEYRELTKARGTYINGFVPAADGCVHTTFTFDTAIAQLSSRNPNCFSPDTEILTKDGWVEFPNLRPDDLVAQWSDTLDLSGHCGIIEFVKPAAYIRVPFDGELRHVTTDEQIDLLMTPDHNCILRDRKTFAWRCVPASGYLKDAHQMQAGTYMGGDVHLSEEQVALICALQADGHITNPGGHYTFSFARERKTLRLRECLQVLGIPFTDRPRKTPPKLSPQSKVQNFYVSRKDIPEWWRNKKFFGSWLLDLTRESLDFMARELWFWDGCWDRQSLYASAEKSNTDWAQIITILSNRRAKIRRYVPPGEKSRDSWQLDASVENYSSTVNHSNVPVSYKGPVYCVSVPKGAIVVRRNGKVAITGNCQNFPKHGTSEPQRRLFTAMRRMIAAKPGKILLEIDYKSCHVLTLGFLAGDATWMRLARLDMHSFITGLVLNLWDTSILRESDDELLARFKWLKSNPEWKHIRDDQAKHADLGVGNGLKAKGLFERYPEEFGTQKRAQAFLTALMNLAPRVFKWQENMKDTAHDQQELKSPFGHLRRFYEVKRWDTRKMDWGHGDQAEEAVAYMLSNVAHAHMRESMKELERRGYNERYNLCNQVHDSLLFHLDESLLDQCLADVVPVMTAPSKVLRSPLAPNGLHIDVEASAGPNWSEMREISLPKLAPVMV